MKTIWDYFLEDILGADAFHLSLAEILKLFYEHVGVTRLEQRLKWRETELQKDCVHSVHTCGPDTGGFTECSRCGSRDVPQMSGDLEACRQSGDQGQPRARLGICEAGVLDENTGH